MLVDFWAPWCGPCRVVHPILEEIAAEREDLKHRQLNTDENPQTAAQYKVHVDPDDDRSSRTARSPTRSSARCRRAGSMRSSSRRSPPPRPSRRVVIITTMNDLPGYSIDEVFGEVFGLTVRSRNVGSQIGATFKSLVGGELKGMTKMLAEGRKHATERLVEEAEAKGANAIIAFRFDTSELGTTWTEICAYGTAVRVSKNG